MSESSTMTGENLETSLRDELADAFEAQTDTATV